VELFTNPLLIEFLLGTCVGTLARTGRFPARWIAACMCVVAVSAILVGGGSDWIGNAFDPMRVWVWGIPAAALVWGTTALEASGALPAAQFLIRLGDSSYSLYLTQEFTLHFVAKCWVRLGLHTYPLSTVLYLLGFVATVLVGHALYVVCERPLTSALKRRWLDQRRGGERPAPMGRGLPGLRQSYD
ncbi:MAG: acyltransferase, partial [Acetobacteraceae bacterium]|nr:acyltransferase [Acetobacteraceae bacterium]